MRLGNKKGIIDVAVVTLVAVCGLIAWVCGPQMVKSVGTIFGNGANQKKVTRSVQSERTLYQVDPQHPDKMIPVKEKYSEQSFGLDTSEPPETLWTKFWHLGGVAVLIIIVLSYLGIWPVITLWWKKIVKPKIDATKEQLAALEESHDELKGDAKLIVISVDEGLAAMNQSIATAKATVEAATASVASAGLITDPVVRQAAIANAQNTLTISQAIYTAIGKMKNDFMTALSRKQDTTTKLLVAELKND